MSLRYRGLHWPHSAATFLRKFLTSKFKGRRIPKRVNVSEFNARRSSVVENSGTQILNRTRRLSADLHGSTRELQAESKFCHLVPERVSCLSQNSYIQCPRSVCHSNQTVRGFKKVHIGILASTWPASTYILIDHLFLKLCPSSINCHLAFTPASKYIGHLSRCWSHRVTLPVTWHIRWPTHSFPKQR